MSIKMKINQKKSSGLVTIVMLFNDLQLSYTRYDLELTIILTFIKNKQDKKHSDCAHKCYVPPFYQCLLSVFIFYFLSSIFMNLNLLFELTM